MYSLPVMYYSFILFIIIDWHWFSHYEHVCVCVCVCVCNCSNDRLNDRHFCLSLYPCVIKFSQSISQSVCLCVCLSVCVSLSLSLSLSVSLSVCLSVCLSLSLCLSLFATSCNLKIVVIYSSKGLHLYIFAYWRGKPADILLPKQSRRKTKIHKRLKTRS